LEIDGNVVLRFALAYGFNNIQNLIQKLKRKKQCVYDYVEVMACPSGECSLGTWDYGHEDKHISS
jgi:iron only hydrogenase large subunit-like protein